MGIPGLRGGDHVGFTVPDMAQAHEFLVDVLGCEFVYALPEMRHDDDWMREHLNVDPRRVVREIRFYRCGFGLNLEVFEYEPHEGQRDVPRNSDLGGHHLALYTDDMDAAVEYLRDRGVRVLAGPVASRNASAGQRWLYFIAPWGMQFELVSYPGGKAYEKDADGAAVASGAPGRVTGRRRPWRPGHRGESPDRGHAAHRDTRRQLPAGDADQAGGHRRPLGGEPHPGARGVADAAGRGPGHAGRQLRRLGGAADSGRVRRAVPGQGAARAAAAARLPARP